MQMDDLEVGRIGIVKSRFNNSTTNMVITSFTDSGIYMRCKQIDLPKSTPDRIKNKLYLFHTKSFIQRGSHMGNVKIYFTQKQSNS